MASIAKESKSAHGFALIITLIMVVLAAILVIAFLSNATLDRTTAKSVEDRYQAEIAVQNGLEAAKKALMGSPKAGVTSVVADDNFLVLRADGTQTNSIGTKDAYYFIAKARPGVTNLVDCYPLFSGGSPSQLTINLTSAPFVQKPQAPLAPFSNPARESSGKLFPVLYPSQQPAFTQWYELHDPNDSAITAPYALPYQRYTFVAEDIAGYLDAAVVGNENGPGNTQKRTNGTNPDEVALFTVFDPAQQPADSGKTPAKNLIDNRAVLFTIPTLKQAASPAPVPTPVGQKDPTERYLAVRVGIDNGGEQDLIPLGYGYANEGQVKSNLNTFIAAKNVNGIASAINTALPLFKNREGGNTFDYYKNLAANIIDYADANNAPTTDGSTYRGIGAFPFLVSAYDLNNWVAITGGPGAYQVQIEVTTYLQLWNPHNIEVNGSLTLHYENVDQLQVNTNTVNYTPPADVTSSLSMQPNEYKVILFPIKTYTYNWGPTPPATAGPPTSQSSIPFPIPTTKNTARLYWNGPTKLADVPNKNFQRDKAPTGMRYNPNRNATNAVWRGNAAPPVYSATGSVGDPRLSFYVNRTWTPADYASNSCWGGRLVIGRPNVLFEVKPTTWPDGGHNSTQGKQATGATIKPDALATQAYATMLPSDKNKWVSRLSIKGSLDTLAELGNIFDIGEWSYAIPSTNPTTSLPDIPSSATADTSTGAGGGYTLCIGRPEFSKFDTNGQRAWQLLDVFSIAPRKVTTGLVNLNTASSETLRAVAAAILLDRDPAISPAGNLYPPKTGNTASEADLFAEAITNSRPLLSLGQVQTIANSKGSFFGNPNQWNGETASATSSAQPTEWNDCGREELFSKIFGLTAVRSRNFRVFVTGQSLDKNGNVLSTVSKVFQVFLKPQRDAAGVIQSQQVEIKYEAFL